MKSSIVNQLISTQIHPQVVDWVIRVVKNGGSRPSQKTIVAVNKFYTGLVANNLVGSFKAMSCFVPDNLIAAITPLIKTYGNDPWTNGNFTAGDLTIYGLKGNGSSTNLTTGVNPNTAFSSMNSGGLTLYNTFADTSTKSDMAVFGASSSGFQLLCSYGGNTTYFDCFTNGGTGRISGTGLTNGLGFTTGNRIASNDQKVYIASSTVAFQQAAGGTGSPGSTRPNYSQPLFCWNNAGSYGQYTAKRFSFAAIHEGFTFNDAKKLYDLVQLLRQQLGGGWV